MQPTIHLLSDEAINQIAAGEVIESPASCIKELIENALDAGAKKITIEISGGGLKSLRVADDGVGMHPVDAKFSIIRHATSKIKHAQDLFHIATKGFRGEALASIASVAKLSITTAQEGQAGVCLKVEKGEIVKESSCARTRGTTIEVSSLFYTVPARKKFQKSPAAISAEIFRIVSMMCLSHPDVGFELISNGRQSIKTLPLTGEFSDLIARRAEEMLGREFVQDSLSLKFKEESLEFRGLIGSPMQTRTNRMGQYLYLNQRAVICDALYEAIREGYGTRIEQNRHPVFLLHLNIPSDLIDVNVHPQKLHVRLRSEELLCSKIREAISGALAPVKKEVSVSSVDFTPVEMHFEDAPMRLKEAVQQQNLQWEGAQARFITQMNQYLLFEDDAGFSLVDARAARFTILYEDILSKMDSGSFKQGLLVPFSIDLTPVESAMVLTHLDAIEAIGFSLRPIGKEVFMVEALPQFIEESEVANLIASLVQTLQDFIGKMDYHEERKKSLALRAAKMAKMRVSMTEQEANHLMRRLKETGSLYSPDGDPITVVLDDDAIESVFRKNRAAPKRDQIS